MQYCSEVRHTSVWHELRKNNQKQNSSPIYSNNVFDDKISNQENKQVYNNSILYRTTFSENYIKKNEKHKN